MNITFVLPETRICGGIRSTFELSSRMVERGHRVKVIYPLYPIANGAPWYNLKKQAGRAARCVSRSRQPVGVDWFDLKAELLRVPWLSNRWIPDADFIVATWWENAFHVHRLAAGKGRKVHFIRGYETWGGPHELVTASYRLPNIKIATSGHLIELIGKEHGVTVQGPIPNGLDSSLFFREKANVEHSGPLRVGMLYRKTSWKSIDDGLAAVAMAKQRFPGFQLVVFGEDLSQEHQHMVSSFPGTQVCGMLHTDALRKLYNSLDVFLFSSQLEGFGNPPMEAMACGAACVSTAVGAVPDYTDGGSTAILVDPGDPGALAAGLVKLLENDHLRHELSEAGSRRVSKMSWSRSVISFESILENAVGNLPEGR